MEVPTVGRRQMEVRTAIEATTRTEEATTTEVATRMEVVTWMEMPRWKVGIEARGQLTRSGRRATGTQTRRRLLQLVGSYLDCVLLLVRLSSVDFGPRTSHPNLCLW
jgi:hypothetical protein